MDIPHPVENREVDLDALEEEFKSFLYSQKGKVTNERLALLRTLYEHEGHFSVDDILEMMGHQHIPISRATVYRTLDLLVQAGLIKRLALENQDTKYESARTSGHHDHIICVNCHRIIEFFSPELEKLQDEILARYNFKMARHVHQIYGYCDSPECAKKGAFRAI